MNYLITVISRQLYAGWKWNKSNSRTQPDQPLWPILPPIWTVDAMCCCGTLCSPGRPQLGPRVLLYFLRCCRRREWDRTWPACDSSRITYVSPSPAHACCCCWKPHHHSG